MDTYPFNQLWHRSRGIVFGQRREQQVAVNPSPDGSDLPPSSTIRNPASEEELWNGRQTEGDDSDSETASFTTAHEHNDKSVPSTGQPQVDESVETAPDGSAPTDEPKDKNIFDRPPVTSLVFNIPEEVFVEAENAPEGSMESFWSYTLYRASQPKGEERRVKVHYCKSRHTMERVCKYFVDEKVIGFDLEWQPEANRFSGPRQNVSLIQMASPSRIALFHVALFPKSDMNLVSTTFRQIMEDPDVSKVGVAIKGDGTRLRTHLGVAVRGLFELSHLYKLVKYSASGDVHLINKKGVSLARQVEDCLGLPMFKGQDVRASNWSQPLNMAQIVYSACDAYAGLQLYHVLDEKRQALDPMPPLPYHAELGQPIRLAEGTTVSTTVNTVEVLDAEDTTATVETTTTTTTTHITTPTTTLDFSSAQQTVQVEVEGDNEEVTPPGPRKRPLSTPSSSITRRPKDDRVLAAEAQVASYRASHATICASNPQLRSYYIWHDNEGLDPKEIARILRQTPLQTNTVVGYILEAIRLEGLPFDGRRLQEEVLNLVSKESRERRYAKLVKQADKADRVL
ncbi:ribonuclease H-like protein [Sodiomyces alkalinus F11]|uniref:Ribonuclease H-like protein n=1 Tax=Sodiomyces alkalinus (strain CBS 110278 / VKM F-3762 / F11) TaxID=1314773 RepID=A0A3N2PX91_SODAK|nr:ribonuclease H-like protein [Sodiomyces alkalinus F11]ROT39153.1 ribonuclease H-like protein [Sodiomyces alkalinus F11]